jgi:hypothetical protein
MAAQGWRLGIVESAAEGFADRGSRCAYYYRFSHFLSPGYGLNSF